jgi:hypothetical protein
MADLNLRDGKSAGGIRAGWLPRVGGRKAQGRVEEKAVHGALIRLKPMLSTLVNPTDGHRFDGVAPGFAEGGAYLSICGRWPPEGVGDGAGI